MTAQDGDASRHGRIERFFQWASGYSPRTLACESPQDCEPISKIGGAVFVATLVAASNWAIAAFVFTAGSDRAFRFAAALIAATVAAAVVLVLDRSALYGSDAVPLRRGVMPLWLAARIVMISIVSAITSQAVMPVLQQSELSAHSLHMQEAAETRRIEELRRNFELDEKQNAVSAAQGEVRKLEAQSVTLPPSIQNRLVDARSCWADYNRRKRALTERGAPEHFATALLGLVSGRCSQKQKSAESERQQHEAAVRAKREDALARLRLAQTDANSAVVAVSTRIDQARSIEQRAITPWSSSVQADLLANDVGARITWLFITVLLVTLELQPLIVKVLIGKSPVGMRISADRAVDTVTQQERIAASIHDAAVTREISTSLRNAMLAACQDPQARDFCAKLFAKKIGAFLPLEVVDAFLREMEQRQPAIDKFVGRYPRYAPLITGMLSDAMREVGAILSSHGRLHPHASFDDHNLAA